MNSSSDTQDLMTELFLLCNIEKLYHKKIAFFPFNSN